MHTYLQRLIEYNNWANRELIERLGALPPETLDATAPGVYGSLRETLLHLLTSELSYHRRLTARPPADVATAEFADIAFLRQLAAQSAAELTAVADSLPDPGSFIQLSDGKRSAATMLTQLFMHGCEHRTHVGTILCAHGIEPPDLDSWAFGILLGGDDWPTDWGPEPASR
ncbi:MAG: DinB family protein [Tepidiformaceae bacterium]